MPCREVLYRPSHAWAEVVTEFQLGSRPGPGATYVAPDTTIGSSLPWQSDIILLAMLVETAMSLAAPWPLKIIIDNVVGNHKLPHWLDDA